MTENGTSVKGKNDLSLMEIPHDDSKSRAQFLRDCIDAMGGARLT
ncbi:hypothetical protein Vi05172_g3890 [Venturia inaequalis]|nr:hypothetical protein Vi05172_g3890 [Venturia inaequalis]